MLSILGILLGIILVILGIILVITGIVLLVGKVLNFKVPFLWTIVTFFAGRITKSKS